MSPRPRTSLILIAVALALIVGSAVAASSFAGHRQARPAHHPHVAVPQAVASHRPVAAADQPLPFAINLRAMAAVVLCLALLVAWGWWQTRNRCGDCGYSPAFCRCDELARPPSER